tara:strand:- start:4782 stop:5942 length:1161 start_codon:yes stop_codon:yes gene_type:complete
MKKLFYFITIFMSSVLYSECYELSQADCLYWNTYCEWNENTNQCQEIGGGSGGGGGESNGPFDYLTISESQGLRNGPDYRDGVLYYPLEGNPPYKSIVLTPGFGGGSSEMSSWAEFYASHGFIALRIGPNDEINDSHYQRGLGLIDGIETIRQENNRINSPLYGLIDEDNYSVSGYSMGGGASHDAAMMDNSIKAVISLNPTVIFEDCNLCPAGSYEGEVYCICLVPEFVNHPVPSLIFAGQVEADELTAYAGMLGQDIYANMPETTDKIMFEGANSGHGFAAYPYGEVAQYALDWLNYQVLNDESTCELLTSNIPSTSSQYLTNITCSESLIGDVNSDGLINVIDIISIVNLILVSDFQSNADINNDLQINVLDIVSVVNLILGQ